MNKYFRSIDIRISDSPIECRPSASRKEDGLEDGMHFFFRVVPGGITILEIDVVVVAPGTQMRATGYFFQANAAECDVL